MVITEDCFGFIKNKYGETIKIRRFTLCNGNLKMQVMNYGATITSLHVPDKDGELDDIVLGFDNISSYINDGHYFGCTVGRFANRISKGKFVLGSQTHQLVVNDGPNHLNGGIKGFDKVIWDCLVENDKLHLTYISPSMEENYPGEVTCQVTFEITPQDEVCISYRATTTSATPINITNHSYFNLSGHHHGNILSHIISINADHYTPVDATSIPTGEIRRVDGSAFDLRQPQSFVSIQDEKLPEGLDHNFCVNGALNTERKVASVFLPKFGRLMEVYSTQPGVQVYTANFLPNDDPLIGKENAEYWKQSGLCLETQNYPDAVNHANFPNAILDVGEVYCHKTKYCFSIK